MAIIQAEGIVIKEVKYGDSDKIYTLFTKEFGKISARAKGVSNFKSKLMHGTNFLCYSKFILYQFPKSYLINQCDIIHSFYKLSEDIEKVSYAAYFAELISDLSVENQSNENILKLFLNSLHLLVEGKKPKKLIQFVFELRMMCESGYTPDLSAAEEGSAFFDVLQGKVVPFDSVNRSRMIELNMAQMRALQYVMNADHNTIFSFTCGEELLDLLIAVSNKFLLYHLEKTPKTLKFLNDILYQI